MNEYIFLSADRKSVSLRTTRTKATAPAGSYAAASGKLGDVGALDRWTAARSAAAGIARVVPAAFDAATETVTARDFERNGDGTIKITDGEAVETATTTPIPAEDLAATAAAELAAAQAQARADLARAAEAARMRFLTAGDGKAQAYRVKAEEVARWDAIVAAAGTPDPDAFPWAKDRADVLSQVAPTTVEDVIDEWRATVAGWGVAGRAIEKTEDAAKLAIDGAADAAAAHTIVPGLEWPAPPEE